MFKSFCGTVLAVFLVVSNLCGAQHKLRVNDRALAASLVARGARLVADYGAFQILETSEVPPAKALRGHAHFADQLDSIELNAISLDTRNAEIRASPKSVPSFSGRRLHLIQFVGPIKSQWRAALEKTGVRIVNYLPHDAYLVRGDAAALARLQAWADSDAVVQWEGDYAAGYKIHPGARLTDAKGNPRTIGTTLFSVQLIADAGENAETLRLIDRLKLAPVVRTSDALGCRNIIVALPADQLETIAAQPDVVSIHAYFTRKKRDERQDQIIAGNIAGNAPSGPGYLDWLASKGFTQEQFDESGFVVDVADSGIDNGSLFPGHFALYPLANIAGNSRIAYNRLEGTPNAGSTLAGCDGHGNLNAQIIGGYDAFGGGFPHADSGGFNYGLGVCPFVKLGSSVVFDPNDFTGPDYSTLATHAYNSGARISNNSWGGGQSGDYDSDAQEYDAIVRDVGEVALQRQMIAVFVAGNGGPSGGTIDSPGSAKNVITVGASENVRSMSSANGGNRLGGTDGCSTSDSDADSANDVVDFSSRGPCADGRVKPDLVAPGTHITGGAPQAGAATTNGIGDALSCFNGQGVCALSGGGAGGAFADNFFPLNQRFYTASSGTSHAAPAVSGACALLRQYFINHGLTPPSPAMTKAFLMNSARYLTGRYAGDTLPSPSQGMGALNLGMAFDEVARGLRDQLSVDVITNSGARRTFTGSISDPSRPFRVTLAWTDAVGSTAAGRALVNDLDLTVTIGGQTYKGNVFSGAESVAGGVADSLNNVESVFLPAGQSGPFVVTVTGANIVEDAITRGASPQQDFALVVYNSALAPAPALEIKDYAVVGESCSPTNGAVDSGETVTVNFSIRNSGTTDTTNLVVTLLESNGVSAASGPRFIGTVIAGGAAVGAVFSFTADGSCGDTIVPTFTLRDGAADLGTISTEIHLGSLAPIYVQNFDGAGSGLPPFWTTTRSGGQGTWSVRSGAADTLPKAAFSAEAATPGVNALVSPVFHMPAGGAQIAFQQSYQIEAGYDGGVMEIKIGDGEFTDILEAGGSFVAGGYDRVLSASANPLSGRSAWTGDSGGFVPVIVNLPPAISGQSVQLRWRFGTDRNNGVSVSGWRIDSVQLNAYACCGGEMPAAPFEPSQGVYNGLFYETNEARSVSSGFVSINVNARGSYSGVLRSGKARAPFSGTFDVFGFASNRIARAGTTPLTLLMRMSTPANDRITGAVSDGTWTATLDAERSLWNARTNPAPFAGKYTLIFPGAGNPADTTQPQGDGFALATVSAAGKVTLSSGALADDQAKFTQSAQISEGGLWPLYSALYGGQGQIIGWLTFSNLSPTLGGTFSWSKQPDASKTFYPGGFTIQSNAITSPFQPTAAGASLFEFTSGVAQFSGGNYFGLFSNWATNTLARRMVYKGTNGLSMMLNTPQAGLFRGTIAVDASGKKKITFAGAILESQQAGSGFWLGTNQSGKVAFGP